MRDPKRIPRLLRKLERAWKKKPDHRLFQFLLDLATDPDERLEPPFIDDDHLEQILDKKVPRTKTVVTFDHLFEMAYRMLSPEARAEVDAFIRYLKAMTRREFLNTPGVWKMETKDWYAVKLKNWRIVIRPMEKNTVLLLDVVSEKAVRFFNAQFQGKQ